MIAWQLLPRIKILYLSTVKSLFKWVRGDPKRFSGRLIHFEYLSCSGSFKIEFFYIIRIDDVPFAALVLNNWEKVSVFT